MPLPILALRIDPASVAPSKLDQLRSLIKGRYDLFFYQEDASLKPVIERVEILLGWPFPHFFQQATALKWLQNSGAGTDWMLHPEYRPPDSVRITSAVGIHGKQISEHILAFLLSWTRRFHDAYCDQTYKAYNKVNYDTVDDLDGKTMLIMGCGHIGKQTARIAQAFGMQVWGIRRNPRGLPKTLDRTGSPDDLHTWLPHADVVVNILPYTPETHALFDRHAFQAMKPTAFFINVGRGKTVNEPDLIQALQTKTIAGAGLDVFETEPLPQDSPLWDLDNVILTAHYSGRTQRYWDRLMGLFLQNLERFLSSESLLNELDK